MSTEKPYTSWLICRSLLHIIRIYFTHELTSILHQMHKKETKMWKKRENTIISNKSAMNETEMQSIAEVANRKNCCQCQSIVIYIISIGHLFFLKESERKIRLKRDRKKRERERVIHIGILYFALHHIIDTSSLSILLCCNRCCQFCNFFTFRDFCRVELVLLSVTLTISSLRK